MGSAPVSRFGGATTTFFASSRLGSCVALVVVAAARIAGAAAANPVSIGTDAATFSWTTESIEAGRVTVVSERGAAGSERTVEEPAAARHHVVEVDGLRPGTAYEYRLGGEDESSGGFRTFEPPPGDVVGVVFLIADIHFCEAAGDGDGAGGRCGQDVRRLGFSREAYAAALADIRSRTERLRARFGDSLPVATIASGDVVQRMTPANRRGFVEASGAGPIPCVAPGNHDAGDERGLRDLLVALADAPCNRDGDLDVGPWRILLLDSGSHDAGLGDAGLRRLDEALSLAPDRPTLLAMHHPWIAPPFVVLFGGEPGTFALRDADAFGAVLAKHPQVAAVLSGHIHANWTGKRGTVTQYVFSALVQYPMGYHSITLYRGGFVRRFHPLAATAAEAEASEDAVVAWARERGYPFPEAAPGVLIGSPGDRNSVLTLAGAGERVDPDAAVASMPDASGEPRSSVEGEAVEVASAVGGPDASRPPIAARPRVRGCGCGAAGACRGSPGIAAGLPLLAALAVGRRRRQPPRNSWTANQIVQKSP